MITSCRVLTVEHVEPSFRSPNSMTRRAMTRSWSFVVGGFENGGTPFNDPKNNGQSMTIRSKGRSFGEYLRGTPWNLGSLQSWMKCVFSYPTHDSSWDPAWIMEGFFFTKQAGRFTSCYVRVLLCSDDCSRNKWWNIPMSILYTNSVYQTKKNNNFKFLC